MVALGIALAPLVANSSAMGDPIGDKRAEAAHIAAQLSALQHQVEVLAEQYNGAELQVASVDRQVRLTEAESAAAQRQLATSRSKLRSYAINAYVMGGDTQSTPMLLGGDPAKLPQKRAYAESMSQSGAELINSMRAAKSKAAVELGALAKARQAASDLQATLAAKKSAADSAVAAQQRLMEKVKGDLARLVAEEQARQAAAAQRAAEAAAARSHVRIPTSTAIVPPTTSGGGSYNPGPSVNPPPSSGAAAAIAAAESQLGVPYVWGGATPGQGFDCSGLTMWAWGQAGVSLPHFAAAQYASITHVSLSNIQPGDLLFYDSPIGHVGMYIGGGQMINAPHTGLSVDIVSIYWDGQPVGVGRP